MKYQLKPDGDVSVEKIKMGHILTLIVRPKNPADNAPAVLWIHGGAYILGMKEMGYMGISMDLVRRY